jgi:hypothetical protein
MMESGDFIFSSEIVPMNSSSRLTCESNIPETRYPVLPTPFVEPLRLRLKKVVVFLRTTAR